MTVSKAGKGDGNVTSNPAGIDCGSTCQFAFGGGTPVTLTATPNATSSFVGWKGDCSGTGDCNVTMDSAHSVRAVFARAYRPDAWIKLCGLSTGCTINPPPHPWHGNNRYNSTAKKQTVSVRMEDGEGEQDHDRSFRHGRSMAARTRLLKCRYQGVLGLRRWART